jgi:thioredoxin 1
MTEDKELEEIKRQLMMRIINQPSKGPWKDGEVLTISSFDFDKALSITTLPVFVDFWASWCQPCLIMKPVFESLALKYKGRINFASLNVDNNKIIAKQFGVMSIPYFILFKNGKPIDRVIGSVGKEGLERVLSKHV